MDETDLQCVLTVMNDAQIATLLLMLKEKSPIEILKHLLIKKDQWTDISETMSLNASSHTNTL